MSKTKKIAERLKALRKDIGMSQRELAQSLDISKSSISMYETGAREPDYEMLETIADFFNCDMSYLLGEQSAKNRLREHPDILQCNTDPQLSSKEHAVILAYRSQPAMQPAVDRLLGISAAVVQPSDLMTRKVYRAARSESDKEPGIIELTDEQIKRLENAPRVTSEKDL